MDHSATVFIFHPDAAFKLDFQVPASVDEGLRERNWMFWKATLQYMENQIAAHRAAEGELESSDA